MAALLWNGEPVPMIERVSERRIAIGDYGRAVSGKALTSIRTIKKQWDITTRPMTPDQYEAWIGMLDETMWEQGTIQTEEMESSVDAQAMPASLRTETVAFGDSGDWHTWGRTVTLTIEEV